jgi:tRNA/rRNA methyltransferase
MADTQPTGNLTAPSPIVVLVAPQLGENIGMAARAMANFGLFDLRLVSPRVGWDRERAVNAAAGAATTVDAAVAYPTLEAALADVNYVYATTARPRDMTKQVMTPEQAGLDMRARASSGQKIGLLFGRERYGLSNEEVSFADMIVTAPVNPAYASLNIAQAVLLMGYEWYRHEATTLGMATDQLPALDGPGLQIRESRIATKEEVFGLFSHFEEELEVAGFFKSDKKQAIMMRNIRNIFGRTALTEQEVRSLRGVISSLTRKHLRPKDRVE